MHWTWGWLNFPFWDTTVRRYHQVSIHSNTVLAWNAYQCDISEKLIIETAQLMKKLGLQAAGYDYVNLDDCWSLKNRSTSGHLVAGELAAAHNTFRYLTYFPNY